ncbi:uncharacterized protein Rsod [Anabrus simplex]|uniref:uncharacterized protein Rsod n=1 Tax=Anabrus simplex TaxID=316456 RepID=UPI0035A27D02
MAILALWHNLLVVLITASSICHGIQLTAYLSQFGLHGTVSFKQHPSDAKAVLIHISLISKTEPSEWSWQVHDQPVDYTNPEDRCRPQNLGPVLKNIDDELGTVSLPTNGSSELPLSVELTSLWRRSLILQEVNDNYRRVCATITISADADEKIAEARFYSPLAGSVYFHWAGSQLTNSIDTLVQTNLYRVARPKGSPNEERMHRWKIYTTDILDTEADKARENCNFLQVVFDPSNEGAEKGVGDIDVRLGPLKVAGDAHSRATVVYHDHGLNSLSADLSGQRSLYLVIFDARHHDSFLTCAKIRQITPVTLRALINSEGVKGEVSLSQRSSFDPTWLEIHLTYPRSKIMGAQTVVSHFKIHELPPIPIPLPSDVVEENKCLQTGTMYNPTLVPEDEGSESLDTYAIGDLSGKHNIWRKQQTLQDLNGRYWDTNLPLQGMFSVAHRSLVLYRNNTPWICNTLARYLAGPQKWKMPMFTAAAVYRYPVVGRIVFRQPRDQPWADTTVIVESLVHGDGTNLNNTGDHRWAVHEFPPGRDFYNWSGRCLSAGTPFNPYKVDFDPDQEDEFGCSLSRPGACRIGDLSKRHGTLDIAGRRGNGTRLTRRLYTDTQLPLSGAGSILGRSLVLLDDNGPKARGDRLACSKITAIYRRKAVVKDWFGNGNETALKGKIEFLQQTEYDVTDIEVTLEGLEETSEYHIHMVPVQANLQFPCEATTLYGNFNPHNVSRVLSPAPTLGSTDQYEMGDLSGKFGVLDNRTEIMATFNDTDLPLFGPNSILGRSVVIHKRNRNSRWVCSSIERGYSPAEARERRAIASFHHPLGYAYGYVRMTQLIYNDGSTSDTVIEVNLRHPGKHDRNVTRNHNWAIYVNPVGVDASVQVLHTRCVAGGYIWNPYYTQLADPRNDELYRAECGPDNPLRCYVGDISGRLGTIDMGDKRQVFTDSNLPLEGPVSAMGRSIVVLNQDRRGERYACANIEPDYDIIKYANLQKPPKFVVAQFIEDVQEVMGIPEWMLSVDTRKTKTLHGGACIQFLLHFKGPVANQIEQDFNRLLNTGKLSSPTLYIPGYVPSYKRKTSLSYRLCGSRDPNERKSSRRSSIFSSSGDRNYFTFSKITVVISFVTVLHFFYL